MSAGFQPELGQMISTRPPHSINADLSEAMAAVFRPAPIDQVGLDTQLLIELWNAPAGRLREAALTMADDNRRKAGK